MFSLFSFSVRVLFAVSRGAMSKSEFRVDQRDASFLRCNQWNWWWYIKSCLPSSSSFNFNQTQIKLITSQYWTVNSYWILGKYFVLKWCCECQIDSADGNDSIVNIKIAIHSMAVFHFSLHVDKCAHKSIWCYCYENIRRCLMAVWCF